MAKRGRGVRVSAAKRPVAWITRPCPQCGHPEKVRNGLLLKWWREQAGVSLAEMGKQTDVSSPYLSDIELNKRRCPDYVSRAYEEMRDMWERAQHGIL